MKKNIFTLFLGVLCLTGFSQKPSLTKAYNFFYDKEYSEAKEAIDLCISDAKLSEKAMTWLYKGNIYFYIANDEYEKRRENSEYKAIFPNAAVDAYDALVKAQSMNKNVEAYGMLSPSDALSKIYPLLLFRGVDLLMNNDFATAKPIIEKAKLSYEMVTPPAFPLHGELYYYLAFALEAEKDFSNAKNYYEKAITDGSKNLNVYLRLIEIYKKENNADKIMSLIQTGTAIFENEPAFFIAEIEYYYMKGDTATAQKMLNSIPQTAYSNSDMLVNIANFYIKEKKYSEALNLLKKADKLAPNNFIIYYNLGVCNYYISEEKFIKSNELDLAGKKNEANLMRIESENYLGFAQNFFEKVLETEPDDLNILKTLKSIYARQKSPKYDEINKKIEQLQK